MAAFGTQKHTHFLQTIDLIFSLNWCVFWYYVERHRWLSWLTNVAKIANVCYTEALVCFIIPHCPLLCGHVYGIDFSGSWCKSALVFDLMNWYIFWRNLISDSGWCIKRLLKYNFLWFLYKINLVIIVKTVMITLNKCLLCAGNCINSSCLNLVLPMGWVLTLSPLYSNWGS